MKTADIKGKNVEVRLNGRTAFAGRAEYATATWVGIRQADGRLDEAPRAWVEAE